MPLLKSGEIVDDLWQRTEGETPLGSDGDVVVDWTRLKEDASLRGRNGRLGVQLANNVDVAELTPYLDRLALIVLEFPAFTDGRAFSQATILRQQMGFAGELRATGAPRADQAAHLTRCGFDTIEISGKQPVEVWRHAASVVGGAYQDGYTNDGYALPKRSAASARMGRRD